MAKNVTHLIVGLGKGGAETMLYQVLKHCSGDTVKHSVISLGASHFYDDPIRKLGVLVCEVQFRKRPLQSLWRIFRSIQHTDTLCCWMYHANLVGYYMGKLAGVKKVIWCIRHSNLDAELNKRTTLRINRYCARLSKKVAIITYNGEEARKVHEELGYCHEKGIVLDNGCDCNEYVPSESAGAQVRYEIGVPTDKRLILSVTKDHPIKDIPTFITAFSVLHRELTDVVAVMCGSGVDAANERLVASCKENGLEVGKDIFLLGMRHDVPRLMAGCDLFVLHSAGEAFPNTLVQAMACSCLCITTDVGDAKHILGQEECTVPCSNMQFLHIKMSQLLSLSKADIDQLRNQNRLRAIERYDIRSVVHKYEALY